MLDVDTDSKYDDLLKGLKALKSSSLNKFPGELGLTRTKLLLEKLGNPQEKLKVIHIAGTSGKGSTCFILNGLLLISGFKVGLSLSPHLFDIRERVQINGKFISKEKFVEYFETVNSKAEEIFKEKGSRPTFFEIFSALTFYIFQGEKVDYAIIETGLGGLLDVTNVVSNKDKISVITRIGLDHTHILGNTLSKISYQKIGIVNEHSTVFTIDQSKVVLKVFKDRCKEKQAQLIIVKNKDLKGVSGRFLTHGSEFIVLKTIKISMLGKHQIENCKLALHCFSYLSKRDKFIVDKEQIINCIKNLEFDGRFTIKKIENKTIVFDGAHNPQKIRSLISTLKDTFPKQRFRFLLGFKFNNDFLDIIKLISPISSSITITNINQSSSSKEKNKELENTVQALKRIHFIKYQIYRSPEIAMQKALATKDDVVIVVTGSFYLISKMRKYFLGNIKDHDL